MGMYERALECKEKTERFQTSITLDPELVIKFFELKKNSSIAIDTPFQKFVEDAIKKYIKEVN